MKPKVFFVYGMPKELEENWRDGLWAALNILDQDFDITRYNTSFEKDEWTKEYDVILAWGAFDSIPDLLTQQRKEKKALCLGGYLPVNQTANNYDIIFYETQWSKLWLEFQKVRKPKLAHAFGVNANIFNMKPYARMSFDSDSFDLDSIQPFKIWDYITIGYLSFFKNQLKVLEKKGSKLLVGKVNNTPEAFYVASELLTQGCTISDVVPPETLANLYRLSKTCYFPGNIISGGERSILEARACGIEVEVEYDNTKLLELTRSPIWDENYYAQQLKEGILSIL